MKRIGLAAAVAFLLACGGKGGGGTRPLDYSSDFTGTWSGSTNVVLNGQAVNSPGTFTDIVRTGDNTVVVNDICGDGSGPTAIVENASVFTMAGKTCPPAPIGSCPSVSLVLDAGGTGTLANGQLTISATGSLSGCGSTYPGSFSFTGTRTGTAAAGARAAERRSWTEALDGARLF